MNAKTKLMAKFAEMLEGPLTLQKAIIVAVVAHGKQEDKGGNAYIRHPLRVMEQLDTQEEMVCGVMHDAIEDTDLTLDDLAELGFTHDQIKTIAALTKMDGYDHDEYLTNIEKSETARKIKILDMKDNSRLDRLKNITLRAKDIERFQRYIHDLHRLGGLKK